MRELDAGRRAPRRRRIRHVPSVDLVQRGEVVGVGVEDRCLDDVGHRRPGGIEDGREVAERLLGLCLDAVGGRAGRRVDARGAGAEHQAAGDDCLAVRAECRRGILGADCVCGHGSSFPEGQVKIDADPGCLRRPLEQAGRRRRRPQLARRRSCREHRLSGGEQPGLEQLVQLLARDPLGQRDELAGGAVAAGPPRRPRPQDPEEVPVTHLVAEHLQGHGTTHIHRAGEQERDARVADDHVPERVVGGEVVVEEVEDLLGGPRSSSSLPQPLGVGGEALVEPDVLPLGQGHAVAEPLVGELVHHQQVAVDRVGEEGSRVDRAGLVLQGEEQVGGVVDDPPAGGERVGPEPPGQEVEDLALAGQRAVRDLPEGRRRRVLGVDRLVVQVGVDRVVHPQPLGCPVAAQVELADRGRGQIGRHRLGGVPDPGRPVAVGPATDEAAVGDRLEPRRDRHDEGEGRLVGRVVVEGEPVGRALGLAHHDRAVVGVDPAVGQRLVGDRQVDLGPGHAVVADHGREPPALLQLVPWGHGQLVVLAARPPRPLAVDHHRADGHPLEVEVEPAQRLGGPGRDRRHPDKAVRRRVVGDLQQVVGDVVAAVAVQRVVVVADAWGARVASALPPVSPAAWPVDAPAGVTAAVRSENAANAATAITVRARRMFIPDLPCRWRPARAHVGLGQVSAAQNVLFARWCEKTTDRALLTGSPRPDT